MRTLHELPRFRDRWSYLYLEMGRLDVDAEGLGFHQGDKVVPVPIDQLSVVMLGPGSTVTHAAIKSLSQNNCLLAWTGQDGVRLYAASIGGTYSARRVIRQAKLVSDEEKRLEVAWRMYHFRFNEDSTSGCQPGKYPRHGRYSCPQDICRSFGKSTVWSGKAGVMIRMTGTKGDPINRALSAANACLYGVCHAGILSAGYSSALGFVHTGKMLSFVYDVADLYKTETTIPVAFRIAAANPPDLERAGEDGMPQSFS